MKNVVENTVVASRAAVYVDQIARKKNSLQTQTLLTNQSKMTTKKMVAVKNTAVAVHAVLVAAVRTCVRKQNPLRNQSSQTPLASQSKRATVKKRRVAVVGAAVKTKAKRRNQTRSSLQRMGLPMQKKNLRSQQ